MNWITRLRKRLDERKYSNPERELSIKRRPSLRLKKGLCKLCGHNKLWYNKDGSYKCTKCGKRANS